MPVKAVDFEHRIVHADPFSYSAHPHGVRLPSGDILAVFNRAPRRAFILHPPQDPAFENVLIRSGDEGASWSAPGVVPDYGWSGVECAGLTALRGGRVLLNQWRFRWYPLPLARRLAASETIAFPRDLAGALGGSPDLDSAAALRIDPERLAPWARGPGQGFVHISDDSGETFAKSVELATSPYSGGYGMRGAVELPDGAVLLPLCDVPAYRRVFVLCSADGGESWGAPIHVAGASGREFEEPAPIALPSDRILMLLRENRTRTLFSTHSGDAGRSWSEPRPTGIDGYPAHLVQLADGRLLCSYGFRRPPFAIRAVLSEDGGATWDTERPIDIRTNLPNKDLGYPFTLALAGGLLLTLYYAQDGAGTTCIWSTRWRIED